jgi:adenylate cyclase
MHVDVEGSTALATAAGDAVAQRVLADTKGLVREHAEVHGGREIDAVGDAMMLTFGSARAAIGAATEVQETLARREHERPEESLRVRIGINVGEVLSRDGHPFGAAVNAGARVMAKGRGGEILVSELAHGLTGTIPGVSFRDRGRHTFKGFDEPWRIYQVVWPGAPAPRAVQRKRLSRRLVLLERKLQPRSAVRPGAAARGDRG